MPDPTTRADAQAVAAKHGLELPASVAAFLDSDASETPKPGDPRLADAVTRIIAAPKMSLDAAEAVARYAGLNVIQLGDAIEGESRDVAAEHARPRHADRRRGA